VLLATLQGSRPLVPAEVQEMEKQVNQRLQSSDLHLLTRCLSTVDVDAHGRILYAWAHFGPQSPEDAALQDRVQKAVAAELKKFSGLFVNNVDALSEGDHWNVRVDASGVRVITPKELIQAEKSVTQQVNRDTKIFLWFHSDAMLTRDGLSSVEEFTSKRLQDKGKREQSAHP
jgi:hypothetical protein